MDNKRGQFESYLLAVVTIFIIGIILFFFNHVAGELYGGFNQYFESAPDYNNTEAHQAMQTIEGIETGRTWDYAFLAIFIGIIIQILLFSFASRISIAFYWIMIIIDVPILIVGVVVSNIWQSLAADPEFATTILRFPITNAILGSYFPMAVVILLFLGMVILFGKPAEDRVV